MLFRTGGGTAHATSLVRHALGSRFPPDGHPGGEEILVLEGIFKMSAATIPSGPTGAIRRVRGVHRPRLFASATKRLSMRSWKANKPLALSNASGLELLAVSGALAVDGGLFEAWTWVRLPTGTTPRGKAGASGLRLWWKEGPPCLASEAWDGHH